jgi:histidinol-phosphate aminotransferase
VRRARPAPRDDLGLVSGYHSPQLEVKVRLNTNESPYPPPDGWVRELAAEVAAVDWRRYPDRDARRLRESIGKSHGVGPDQVLVGNGSNEVIQAVCLTYGGVGRTAVVFEPTYALHAHIARVTGTDVVLGERGADFALDPDEARRLLADAAPAITFLCSPNNPTGRADDEATVRAVADVAPGVVVVDEAYAQFASWTALDLVGEGLPLVVTRTFSKTWAMAAARLGYLVAPPWIVAELEKVLLPYHVDAVKQVAGRLALAFRPAMERRVAEIVSERERLQRRLAQLPVDWWPSAANFVLFRPHHLDADQVWNGLVERSVLVRNCSRWPRLDACLRVTVGTPEEDDAFITALEEVLR